MLFMGEFHAVQSRSFAGAATLLNVGLAIGSTFGLASLIGSFYGPVHQILPLLLLGVGADDGFVVVQALDDVRANPRYASKPARERVAVALSNSGVAIFLTSATNVAVFLISSATKLPALRHFSWWAALGVFFDFFYTLLFLVPCLLWDERRMAAGRRDCVPCVRAKAAKAAKGTNVCGVRLGFLSRFLSGPFARVLLHRYVRLGVLGGFVAFFGAMVYGASQLELRSQFVRLFSGTTPPPRRSPTAATSSSPPATPLGCTPRPSTTPTRRCRQNSSASARRRRGRLRKARTSRARRSTVGTRGYARR
eukprot:TRINITY_DN2426_c0_g1_i9.p2 TRINITY_DN2426_c0_g1~~TRINITY_DN2426_c0_g1_i9.p2  ORF type:complete len:308 (-),score=97.39 TRINITY_DN2426_c0_g1_i9:572-1495(-)